MGRALVTLMGAVFGEMEREITRVLHGGGNGHRMWDTAEAKPARFGKR